MFGQENVLEMYCKMGQVDKNFHVLFGNTCFGLALIHAHAFHTWSPLCLLGQPPVKILIMTLLQLTCPCSSVVNTLGRRVQWSVTRLRSRVQRTVRARPSTFHQRIISNNSYARDEQGDNPGQETRIRRCPL